MGPFHYPPEELDLPGVGKKLLRFRPERNEGKWSAIDF